MMTPFSHIEKLLLRSTSSQSPLLLALSGGADSLYLFYALLYFREQHGILFHVAHVDHRWRKESQEEAESLRQLAIQHRVPFHLKILDPSIAQGNLEAACREERYAFFYQLFKQFSFQALLTGHHHDDQAETVFKRLLEGAHWSRWGALQHESWINGMRVLRPLLDLRKKDIQHTLFENKISFFEDPSNKDERFLRARLRESIFPRLNQEFGKEIEKNLVWIADEAQELKDFFDERLIPLLNETVRSSIGIYLDLQERLPTSLLEIKYLLRLMCQKEQLLLSREIIKQIALSLKQGKANQLFVMANHHIWIDRKRIFILSTFLTRISQELSKNSNDLPCDLHSEPVSPYRFNNRCELLPDQSCIAPDSSFPTYCEKCGLINPNNEMLQVVSGKGVMAGWVYHISQAIYPSTGQITSWKEGWKGVLRAYLPLGDYQIGFKNACKDKKIKKRWNEAKVPAFLYFFFPLIWGKEGICHEFLTGKMLIPLSEGAPCWKIEMINEGDKPSC